MEIVSEKEKPKQSKFGGRWNQILVIGVAVIVIINVLPFAFKIAKGNPSPQEIYQKVLKDAQSKYPGFNEEEFQAGYKKGIADGEADSQPSVIISDPVDSYKLGFSYGYSMACVKIHIEQNEQSVCQDRLLGK